MLKNDVSKDIDEIGQVFLIDDSIMIQLSKFAVFLLNQEIATVLVIREGKIYIKNSEAITILLDIIDMGFIKENDEVIMDQYVIHVKRRFVAILTTLAETCSLIFREGKNGGFTKTPSEKKTGAGEKRD